MYIKYIFDKMFFENRKQWMLLSEKGMYENNDI